MRGGDISECRFQAGSSSQGWNGAGAFGGRDWSKPLKESWETDKLVWCPGGQGREWTGRGVGMGESSGGQGVGVWRVFHSHLNGPQCRKLGWGRSWDLLKLEQTSASPGGWILLKYTWLGHPQSLQGLGWGLSICISNKTPGLLGLLVCRTSFEIYSVAGSALEDQNCFPY